MLRQRLAANEGAAREAVGGRCRDTNCAKAARANKEWHCGRGEGKGE